jgi:hypothetical protein
MNERFGAPELGFWTCTATIELDVEFDANHILKVDMRIGIVSVSQETTQSFFLSGLLCTKYPASGIERRS